MGCAGLDTTLSKARGDLSIKGGKNRGTDPEVNKRLYLRTFFLALLPPRDNVFCCQTSSSCSAAHESLSQKSALQTNDSGSTLLDHKDRRRRQCAAHFRAAIQFISPLFPQLTDCFVYDDSKQSKMISNKALKTRRGANMTVRS